MSRVPTPGDQRRWRSDGPKCQVCGKPAVWSGYCQMEDGKGYCDSMVLEPLPATMMLQKGIPAPGDWKIDDKVAAAMVKALEEGHGEQIVVLPKQTIDYEKLYPADEWFEELGYVIWWKCPVDGPPLVSTPLDLDFDPNYYTHFSLLTNGGHPQTTRYLEYIDHLNRSK